MQNKNIVIVVIIILLLVAFFAYRAVRTPQPTTPSPVSQSTGVKTAPDGTPFTEPLTGPPSPVEEEEEENIIAYTDQGFNPSTITIEVGEAVTFVNQSSIDMWPASAVHPTHTIYPTQGGCIGSTFDACRRIPPGESWTFVFEIPGEWKFHDHLSPQYTGKVIVEEKTAQNNLPEVVGED